jgi:hypothetical protein
MIRAQGRAWWQDVVRQEVVERVVDLAVLELGQHGRGFGEVDEVDAIHVGTSRYPA